MQSLFLGGVWGGFASPNDSFWWLWCGLAAPQPPEKDCASDAVPRAPDFALALEGAAARRLHEDADWLQVPYDDSYWHIWLELRSLGRRVLPAWDAAARQVGLLCAA